MNRTGPIPTKTLQRLSNPAGPGKRHTEIVTNAAALVAAGLNCEAIFHQIRPAYASDVSDSEIRSIINWAKDRFNDARPNTRRRMGLHSRTANRPEPKAIDEKDTPERAIARFLGRFSCDEADVWESSPIRLPDSCADDAEALLAALYGPFEKVNIVWQFSTQGPKAVPKGYGQTFTRDEWLTNFRRNGPPISQSGVWIRPNPTDGRGIADQNVTAYRFALIEFDGIPLSLQLAFLAKLPLPISAIISSGGKSLHAWISIRAENSTEYREKVTELFRLLAPFGIDVANRNPSRLSRLPGVIRQIGGAATDNRQRLLYLNPVPQTARISA